MGRRPKEEELAAESAEVLERILKRPPHVLVNMDERQRLLDNYGETEENVDIFLSLGKGDE